MMRNLMRISRKQCGCDCIDEQYADLLQQNYPWIPYGSTPGEGPLPTVSCSKCEYNPCTYNINFGCTVNCYGLIGSSGVTVSKDDCLFEDSCRWTSRTISPVSGCAWYGQYGQSGFTFDNVDHRCDTDYTEDFGDLSDATLRWELNLTSSTSATVTGTDSNGDTIVYSTDNWVCPTELNQYPTNTLRITSYPDGLENCGKFPKAICVTPSGMFRTFCTDANAAADCCDNGRCYACFGLEAPDCFIDTTFPSLRYKVDDYGVSYLACNNIPAGYPPIGFPDGDIPVPETAPCGFWWGTASICSGNKTLGLLVWCDGTDYRVQLWCYSSSTWSMICDTTGTRTRCCPNWEITFDCDPAEFSACCCPDPCEHNTDCCNLETDVSVTIGSSTNPACACATGVSFTATNTAPDYWTLSFTFCGVALTGTLACAGGAWAFSSTGTLAMDTLSGSTSENCVACPSLLLTIPLIGTGALANCTPVATVTL